MESTGTPTATSAGSGPEVVGDKPTNGLVRFLGTPIGPLPLGIWMVVVAAGIGLAVFVPRLFGGASSTDTTGGDGTGGGGDGTGGGGGGGGGGNGTGGGGDGTGDGQGQVFDMGQQDQQQQQNYNPLAAATRNLNVDIRSKTYNTRDFPAPFTNPFTGVSALGSPYGPQNAAQLAAGNVGETKGGYSTIGQNQLAHRGRNSNVVIPPYPAPGSTHLSLAQSTGSSLDNIFQHNTRLERLRWLRIGQVVSV